MQGIDNLPKSGGSSTLSGLADVNFSSLTQGDLLIYDGAEWINHSFTEGHTILNESGTAVTARDNLQFSDGLKVTDDSGNNKTKVGVDTTFTEAVTRTNIASGDTFSTILGKIKKFFTDLKTVAFTGSYNDLSNKPTIPSGSDYVAKTGDTMTGALTVNESSAIQATFSRSHSDTTSKLSLVALGNNIAEGTAGSAYGALRFYGKSSKYVDLVVLPTSNRSINLPDESGTLALKPTVELLENNIFISTSDAWIGLMNPSLNLDNYEYIGFSWTMSDNTQTQKQIQTIMKMSDFKTSSQSAPVIIVDDPYSAFSDARRVKVAWDDSSSFSLYRGNEVYMYRRLNIFGINF